MPFTRATVVHPGAILPLSASRTLQPMPSGGSPARQKMIEAHRLREALAQIVPPDRLGEWMRTPNPAFEGHTPIQVLERGESDRLWRMIVQIDSNVAS